MKNITLREWQKLYKDPKDLIVQASVTNGSDAWQPFPIGYCWQYGLHYQKGAALQIGNHENLVTCHVTPDTDSRRRPSGKNRRSILAQLEQHGISNRLVADSEYFDQLPSYQFVISPEGNGLDCHRHYEALLAGCIPIMEHHQMIEEKYKGCPILYTNDYSEITPEYLSKVYEQMLDTHYDFSCLFMSSYTEDQQRQIRHCGNFWMTRLTHSKWYS
jgi:hypothetical protein